MDLTEWSGEQQDRHPWEKARAAFFARILRDADLGPVRLLDVGSGDGWLARTLLASLPAGSEATCCDANYSAEHLARLPANERVRYVVRPPEERFDLVLLLDVLEHVPDDRALLTELVEARLKPGGHLLVSVPAWQRLFSLHDEALGHLRRYSPQSCARMLRDCDLDLLASGGLFHSLLAPRALRRLGESSGRLAAPANAGEWKRGRVASAVVLASLTADTAISRLLSRRGLNVPGLSWWALCRKQPW